MREGAHGSPLSFRNKHKKLEKLLSFASKEEFVQLIWCAHAAQSGHANTAKRHIKFPDEAIDPHISSQWAIHPWELESLIIHLFYVPKKPSRRRLNCSNFDAIRECINWLREVENAAAGLRVETTNIWAEVSKTGHRHFPWQSGYFNSTEMLRNLYVFGNKTCSELFAAIYGLSIAHFTLVGLALMGHFQNNPVASTNSNLAELGIGQLEVDRALSLMAIAESKASQLNKVLYERSINEKIQQISYPKSWLRQFPIISLGEDNDRLRAPFVDLIANRISAAFTMTLSPLESLGYATK